MTINQSFKKMIHHSHLNTAVTILSAYDGSLPFSHYIKQYFSAHKKYGSKDRKQISSLCYHYFRLGHALPNARIEEKIITGSFFCQQQPSPFLGFFNPDWNERTDLPIEEKLALVGISPTDIFPFAASLSPAANNYELALSYLVQPLLFLRLRPGKEAKVQQQLATANIPFNVINSQCLALANTANVTDVVQINRDVIVQDASSQQVGQFFQQHIPPLEKGKKPSVWDCCAASGGKSILLHDVLKGQCELTVSDIRPSILHNLSQRFAEAGIKNYRSFTANLTESSPPNSDKYNIIICDAPCSGSGTWARTPEQLCFFTTDKIDYYAQLQRQIITNAVPQLQPGGLFFYITCSVFQQENEDNATFIQQQFGLRLLEQQLIQGWDVKADSMFVATFIAN